MSTFKKYLESLDISDISDGFSIDINMFKSELRNILFGDFSKVFGTKFVDYFISELEFTLYINNYVISPLVNNKSDTTIFVNDILDYNIIVWGIKNDILSKMESITFHKITYNLNNMMTPDGIIKGKDRVFRIITLLSDITIILDKKFPYLSKYIGDIFSYFISNYLLKVYDKANNSQKVIIKKLYNKLGENILKYIPVFMDIYDNLFESLNKDISDVESYDHSRLEKLSCTKILTRDFKNKYNDYDIILFNGNSEFKSIIEGKIIFKNYNYQINLNIILGSFELFSDNGTRISNLFNDKAYNILKNDILKFYLESLENSDNPSDDIISKNNINKEDIKFINNDIKDKVDSFIYNKGINKNDFSYKESIEKIKSKSSKQLINAFKKLTKLRSITGSHHIFENKEGNSTFPVPLSKGTVPLGTLNSIIRLSGFSVFEISEKL